ncbi:sigma 54 modulation/S30EA-like ribosomal protein [Kribbella orskensis]|uniref:Sigma 54 modulation/S30EA-like ribosomal protein n=1 Tax=Kribbella orskensis TaxID=2512216 RepID=A0ABY2BAA9_9ACTN|nr:sigma 54 modulation/S30EA-like ribosomal protein [Kribbella sp. VKM Ac-2500]TCO13526.1 sigma 54 modulation/S30EA-like ribosomal protein [Kribbella orskensis]
MDRTPVPRRTVSEALSRLDLTGRQFEFFADKATGRARVVYARYDGHYAMLSAAVPLSQRR